MAKIPKKKDGPHPQANLFDKLQEVPLEKGKAPFKKTKTRRKKKTTPVKKDSKVRLSPSKVSVNTGKDENKKVIETTYKDQEIYVANKEGRSKDKVIATSDGIIGGVVVRIGILIHNEDNVVKGGKILRSALDKLIPGDRPKRVVKK